MHPQKLCSKSTAFKSLPTSAHYDGSDDFNVNSEDGRGHGSLVQDVTPNCIVKEPYIQLLHWTVCRLYFNLCLSVNVSYIPEYNR